MQRRFLLAALGCVAAAGSGYAYAQQGEQSPSAEQQATGSARTSNDSSVGGVPETRGQHGAPSSPSRSCIGAPAPTCEIYFGQ